MGRRLLGLRYAVAMAAVLYAAVIVHVNHPLYHQARPVVTASPVSSADREGCGPVCACIHNGSATSTPSVLPVAPDCPICKFLLHFQPQNLSIDTSSVGFDAAQETSVTAGLVDYVPCTHSSANARAPPSCA